MVDLEFRAEIAELYHRYRHGYSAECVEEIIDRLQVTSDDQAVDLGCGTGQLTMPLAKRTRAVIGVDTESDMLAEARRQAQRAGAANIGWMLADERSLELLTNLLGRRSIAVVAVAQALHWMDHQVVFALARPLLKPGGGIAVVTNGIPLWLQDTDWSKAIKMLLEHWLGTSLTAHCGTDPDSQRRYATDLQHAGYTVTSTTNHRVAKLDFEQLAGGVLSALPLSQLPQDQDRHTFERQLRDAVGPQERFQEQVPVTVLIGRR